MTATAARRRHPKYSQAVRGRSDQLALCQEAVSRVEAACGRRPSFNMILCQHPELDGIGDARLAAMVCSVAIGTTTIDDDFHFVD